MTFGEVLSIGAFKESIGTTKLSVKLNPQTGKKFLTDDKGTVVGCVSKNYNPDLDKEMVNLVMEDTGENIWCLHNPSNTLETL